MNNTDFQWRTKASYENNFNIENGYDACIFLSICDDAKTYVLYGLY